MPVHLQDDHQIILETEEYQAVRQGGHIELWDRAGDEQIGAIPESYSIMDIQQLMSFYHSGFVEGKRYGQISKLNEIRDLLSL